MACARCGAVNPDGNLYCQTCGNALSAPPAGVAGAAAPAAVAGPPPGPPPSYAPPAYSQQAYAPQQGYGPPQGYAPQGYTPQGYTPQGGGYQSPYYAPPAVPTPVHRTPWMMLIAGVVALTLVMAGAGTALAVIGSRSSNSSSNNTASTVGGGIGAELSSPSPGVTPSPVAQPTTSGGAPGTVSNDGLTMPVPSGWTVQHQDSEAIVLYDPDITGSVSAASGPSNPTQTAQDNMNTVDQYFKSQAPDARHCAGTQTTTSTFNGAKGLYWNLCFTITTGGHSVPAAAQIFAGANASGNVYYLVMVVTRDGNLSNYMNTSKPVLQGIHWKLT